MQLLTIAMAARFTQYFTYAELHEFWRSFTDVMPTSPQTNMQPRWHLCPTDPVCTVTHGDKDGTKIERLQLRIAYVVGLKEGAWTRQRASGSRTTASTTIDTNVR